MPLDTIEDPFELSSYESVKQNFVIFYASRDDDGNMWCPVSGSTSAPAKRSTAHLVLKQRTPIPNCVFVLINYHRTYSFTGISATRTAVSWKISLNALLHQSMAQVV
jgi:hypothetical protein